MNQSEARELFSALSSITQRKMLQRAIDRGFASLVWGHPDKRCKKVVASDTMIKFMERELAYDLAELNK